ncbi:response regulator transcription factor [bacterium]|nr:response regulator transcription factor [bacterium]
MKVLIADDSSMIRERITRMILRNKGVTVSGQTDTVKETIKFIKSEKPDAVILDIQFADGTGVDVLQFIRSEPYKPVVIVLTNFPFPEYRKKCMDKGANYFFDKSTEFEEILGVFDKLVKCIKGEGFRNEEVND